VPEVDLDFKPRLNDDLQALLDEPDFDEEAALEVAAELEDGEYEYGDPEVAKQLRSLQKRNAHLESQLVAKSRKGWVAENLRAYPLLDKYAADQVQAIAATSRRAFAREAAKLNATYEKALAPALEEITKAKAALKQQVVTEARDEVKRAWGTHRPDRDGPSHLWHAHVGAFSGAPARGSRKPGCPEPEAISGDVGESQEHNALTRAESEVKTMALASASPFASFDQSAQVNVLDISPFLSEALIYDYHLLGAIGTSMDNPVNDIIHYWVEDSLNSDRSRSRSRSQRRTRR
jgi:hypothetical protein